MREYETTFIIDSLLKSEEIENIIKKYERFISDNGGEIQQVDHWGKKRLAYEIKKRQYGYYVHIRYAGPPNLVKPLEREFRLNESILRYLSIYLDKRMQRQEKKKQYKAPSADVSNESTKEELDKNNDATPDENLQPSESEKSEYSVNETEPDTANMTNVDNNTPEEKDQNEEKFSKEDL